MTKAEVMKKKSFDFEKDLSINKFKLDEECLSHSVLYFRYADACQQAKANVSKADDKLKLVYAERNIGIRKEYSDNGQKFTEALITAELEKDSKVIEAKESLRDAQEIYGQLSVAVQAMETRRSELDNLVKLHCAGYFSTPTTSGEVKKSVNDMAEKEIRKNLNRKED